VEGVCEGRFWSFEGDQVGCLNEKCLGAVVEWVDGVLGRVYFLGVMIIVLGVMAVAL
jgi:hypothetical protein